MATAAAAVALLALVVSVSWGELVVEDAIPDSFALTLLWRAREHDPATIVATVTAAALAACVFLPRRARYLFPALVFAALGSTSAVAADDIAARVRNDQARLVGPNPAWIDDGTAGRPAAYLYDGEPYWNLVWHAVTWNEAIKRVVSLGPARVPGPLPQEAATPGAGGQLQFPERFVVASAPHTFRGEPVSEVDSGTDVGAVRLWRLDGRPRLSTVTRGVLPNGDMVEPARIVVYDCAGGRLKLTLLPKATKVLTILLNGKVALRRHIGGLDSWRGAVEVPRASKPRLCKFTIEGQELLGSTQIEFLRR